MNWIKDNTLLEGTLVELLPLEEQHFDELALLATEPSIWQFIPVDMSSREKCLASFSKALIAKEKANEFPFVIFHKKDRKLVGSTRLMDISSENKKLEIGWTWLHPDYWAKPVNIECKLLLLSFCFEVLKAIRVQLKTDENNIRSRKAIQKIGAQFEGILRQDRIRENGTIRSTAYFSIIDTEWEGVKTNLTDLLVQKR